MATEHTPEPWISEGSFIGIPNGKGTFYMSPLSGINQERREADARRIVACVNACAGLSTGFLEQIDSIQSALTGQLVVTEVLENQRDELLAALEFARQGYQAASENGDPDEVEWAEMYLRSIDIAIASVKEKA